MPKNNPLNYGPSFEENAQFIMSEINKRRNLWTLTSVPHIGWEDVAQTILIHIYEKWHLYNNKKPLGPWLHIIISRQIKNMIRNLYGNYARPCLKCAAAEGENLCKIYSLQCNLCPLYQSWDKGKKRAYEVKMPVCIENHLNDNDISYRDEQDINVAAQAIHEKMKKVLKPKEWFLYQYLFIDHLPEALLATKMGFRSNEAGRKAGYRQIINLKKAIMVKIHRALDNNEIDIL